jgi:hypothetical protein
MANPGDRRVAEVNKWGPGFRGGAYQWEIRFFIFGATGRKNSPGEEVGGENAYPFIFQNMSGSPVAGR